MITPARAATVADQVAAVDLGASARRMLGVVADVLVGALWLLGWTARQMANGVKYVGVAVRQGWRDAAPRREPPPVEARSSR